MASEPVAFAVGPRPLAIFVALVAGHDNDRADLGSLANGLQNVCGAQHIGCPGRDRLVIGAADERLGGEVENDFRAVCLENGADGRLIADVGAVVGDRQA